METTVERGLEGLNSVFPEMPQRGHIVRFGSFPFIDLSDIRPIEWIVLDVRTSESGRTEVLLLSRYGLYCKKFHHRFCRITWEISQLRRWLNGTFVRKAFSEEEQKLIMVSHLQNEDSRQFGTSGGNNTDDRVFCLSQAEFYRYCTRKVEWLCRPTPYSRKQGIGAYADPDGYGCWWLRSPGGNPNYIVIVDSDGTVNDLGRYMLNGSESVRPALRLLL